MRKIYALCIFFLSLFILFFFSITQNPIFASCHDFPKVPFTINPTSGTATTNFTATIQWSSQLSEEDFKKFKDINLHLTAYENDKPVSSAIDSYYDRTYTDRSLRISDFLVTDGEHTLKLHLLGNGRPQCPMESSTPTITVTREVTSAQKKAGDVCNPNLQNDPRYACPPGNSCIQIKGVYQCGIPPGTPFQPDCEPVDKNDLSKGYKFCRTAIGEIPTNPAGLVSFLLRLILGLSGGIALLLIIFSGYRMATAAGNPEALQGARETLTSAIVGLVFIILAIVILRIIGVEILRIPGFGP